MSVFSHLNIRPARPEDVPTLNEWLDRAGFGIARPFGVAGTETAIAEYDGEIFSSLTVSPALYVGPFLKSTSTAKGVDVYASCVGLERALSYQAQKFGALDAYVAVSNDNPHFISIVEKSGYSRVNSDCTLLRRSLSK